MFERGLPAVVVFWVRLILLKGSRPCPNRLPPFYVPAVLVAGKRPLFANCRFIFGRRLVFFLARPIFCTTILCLASTICCNLAGFPFPFEVLRLLRTSLVLNFCFLLVFSTVLILQMCRTV